MQISPFLSFLFLMLSASTNAVASPTTSQCPSKQFEPFLFEFANSLSLQARYSKISKQTAPVMPLESERDSKGLSINALIVKGKTAQATLYSEETGFQQIFQFEKEKDCWYLISIEDHSLTSNGKVVNNWLEYIFPSIESCTPAAFYYDPDRRRSNNGVLEKLGYKPYSVDANTARYKVNERFHGLPVSEVWISSNTLSFVSLLLDATADNTINSISSATKTVPKSRQTDSKGYVVSGPAKKSYFICEAL